jgi:hypothetical protein
MQRCLIIATRRMANRWPELSAPSYITRDNPFLARALELLIVLSYFGDMSAIPGSLANRWTWQPSPNNGCRMDIRCRGHGNYVLVTNVPVQEAKLIWHYQGRSGVGTTFQVSGRLFSIFSLAK